MATPSYFNSIEDCVDALFTTVGNHIVLGIPLGIGKPNPLVNALYQRVKINKAFAENHHRCHWKTAWS